MAIPLKSWFTVFNAIGATETARIPSLGAELPEYANSIILEIVGASTPSWTLDIQGRTHQSGTYVAVDYVRVWQAGAAALANAQLSITDTTRRFYLIPNCPPFLQLIATRTTGTLTVRGSYTSEVFSQWLLTTARGSIYVEGPVASDAAEAGNPVMIGGSVDETTPAAAGEGDARRVRVSPKGNLNVVLADETFTAGLGLKNPKEEPTAYKTPDMAAVPVAGYPYIMTVSPNTYAARRGNIETDNYIAASLVSATQNGADRTNYNFKGLAIFVDVTARSGTSTITIALQLKDGNGNYKSIATAAAALSATGQAMYLIYPTAENAEGWTEMFNTVLGGRTYRVIATYGGSDTISFDVDLVELMA